MYSLTNWPFIKRPLYIVWYTMASHLPTTRICKSYTFAAIRYYQHMILFDYTCYWDANVSHISILNLPDWTCSRLETRSPLHWNVAFYILTNLKVRSAWLFLKMTIAMDVEVYQVKWIMLMLIMISNVKVMKSERAVTELFQTSLMVKTFNHCVLKSHSCKLY